ncbi:MAG: regulatory protein GemA [Rhodoblastus sp.]
MTAPAQIAAIHTMRRQIPGFSEADYRAHLREVYGVASCKELTDGQAARLIAELAKMAPAAGFRAKGKGTGKAARVSGHFGRALQALWIAAWNLGVVENRDDRALLAFVERQTGLSHTRFLHDAKDAAKAIEGLKAWIAREAGVAWPSSVNTLARKRAVIAAQAAIMQRRLPTFDPEKLGALEGFGARLAGYDDATCDRLSAVIGRMIRRDQGGARKRKAA